MVHAALLLLCFVLWAFSFNLVFYSMLLAFRRTSGSALLFSAGMACLALLLALGVYAPVNIAQPLLFAAAAVTCPLCVPLLVKRIRQGSKPQAEAKRQSS